jgi:hypothetical protein
MFCCFPMKGHSALLQDLQREIDEVMQINRDASIYTEEISMCYTEAVHENVRLRSVVSAQRDDIRALEQIVARQNRCAALSDCSSTMPGPVSR